MATVLCGSSLDRMKQFYDTNGTQGPYMWNNQYATQSWMTELKAAASCSPDSIPLEWISWMLRVAAVERPVIQQVQGAITDASGEHVFICRDCTNETKDMQADAVVRSRGAAACSLTRGFDVSESDGIVTASVLSIPERPLRKKEVVSQKDSRTSQKK